MTQPLPQRSGPSRSREDRSAESSEKPQDRPDIAEVERKRIGREFHDGIGQKLTSVSVAASILVEKLEGKGLAEAHDARRLLRLIRETVRDARNLARGLNPAALLNKGLQNALEELLTQIRETTPYTTTLRMEGWQSVDDEQIALHVFRIVQEGVNNAVKHSNGSEITVTLTMQDGTAHVEVADDGDGIPPDFESRSGMGFTLMHQRANALGGSLVTENHNQGGTVIRCSYALERAN